MKEEADDHKCHLKTRGASDTISRRIEKIIV